MRYYKRNAKGKKRNYGRKPNTRSSKLIKTVKAVVKKQMARVIESKIGDYSIEPIPALCLYHNVPSVLDSNMFYVQQGITDEEIGASRNRIGDSIWSKNIQLTLLLTNFATRPNLLYRITVIKIANATTTFPGGSIIYGHPQCGNMMIAPIDTELPGLVSVVYDRVITSLSHDTAQTGTSDRKLVWRYNVKTNHRVKYDNGSADPSTCNYRIILTAYDTQASYITDNVARYTYMRRHHFMDA
jgi:hypothetical protein